MKRSELPAFGNMCGIRVITTGTNIAGPVAGTFLAEQGADVIHVESTKSPDMLRRMGRAWTQEHRNVRSLALNIPSPQGRALFLRLLADADVLIEASKAGQYDKWGLSDETLWAVNPRLVIAHVSGFGQTGDPDYVGRPSFDPIGQAFSGFVGVNGTEDMPYAPKPYTCDFISALFTAMSVSMALVNVQKTGRGESIDLAQYETMVRIQADFLLGGVNDGVQPPRLGIWGNTLQAVPNMQKASDGRWVMTAFGGINVMRNLERVLGLSDDPDFAEPHAGVQKRETNRAPKFIAAVETFFASHTAAEVCEIFDRAGVPCSPVMTYDMMLSNPQYQARETITSWYDPVKGEAVRGCNCVPRFKNNPGQIFRGGAAYGADTDDILSDLGYDAEQIGQFHQSEVVK